MWRWIGFSLMFLVEFLPGQTETQLFDGIHYQHRLQADPPLSIHMVEVDPTKFRMVAARALNSGIGRETVSSIAQRTGALIAINGGFFAIGGRYDGDPVGPLRINGRWYSDSSLDRGAIGWNPDGEVSIKRISVRWYLVTPAGRFHFDGINQQREDGQAVLYNWAFHRSTLTNPGGTEWTIKEGRVVSISKAGDSPIPVEGFVASFGPGRRFGPPGSVAPGVDVTIGNVILSPDAALDARWNRFSEVLGGTPVLLSEGKLPDLTRERVRASFVEERHPRTAVCIKPNGHWLLVVVDGRQPKLSQGMNLLELATLLSNEDCQDALNLDGGGSSTLVIKHEIKNNPSDFGVERPVSDALLVLTRRGEG